MVRAVIYRLHSTDTQTNKTIFLQSIILVQNNQTCKHLQISGKPKNTKFSNCVYVYYINE